MNEEYAERFALVDSSSEDTCRNLIFHRHIAWERLLDASRFEPVSRHTLQSEFRTSHVHVNTLVPLTAVFVKHIDGSVLISSDLVQGGIDVVIPELDLVSSPDRTFRPLKKHV